MAATATRPPKRRAKKVQAPIETAPETSEAFVHEPRVTLRGITWGTYELLLRDRGERSRPRFTFDRGVLEIVSPTMRHEKSGYILGLLIEFVALELRLPVVGVATTTYRRVDIQSGFEGDNSFYISHAAEMADVEDLDLAVHPVPDLVIESDLTISSLNKLKLFARFGVPEVWRIVDGRVLVYVLANESYEEKSASAAIPILTTNAMTAFLASGRKADRPGWVDQIRAWVGEQGKTEPV